MDHSGNIAFGVRFDRQTVASVTHGDNCVLQVAAGGGIIHEVRELRVNTVVHPADRFAQFKKRRACIVGNLILPQHAALDLLVKRGERFNLGKQFCEGIGLVVSPV